MPHLIELREMERSLSPCSTNLRTSLSRVGGQTNSGMLAVVLEQAAACSAESLKK